MRLISLFTGAGGLDWGFHQNDFELLLSNEILEAHLKTYTQHYKIPLIRLDDYTNQSNIAVAGDVHNLKTDISSDVIIGGPPCQDFSMLRGDKKREGVKVKRGKLYQQYLRIIKTAKPKYFVFENVQGMLSANKGQAYKVIQQDFIDEGYELIFNDVINLTSLGSPQARKRLIIIGMKKESIKNRDKIEQIIKNNLSNSLLEKYPLTPLETFEGEILTDLNEKYVKIMKEYEGCMEDIENEYSKKWKEEYSELSMDIVKDYLKNNEIEEYDEDEFKKAMDCHEEILKILGYYKKNINTQQFLDNTNKLPRRNKTVTERMHHIPPYYNFKAVKNTKWRVKGLMSNIYRRIHPLKPSPTIIAYGGGGTGGYHYEYNRQGLTNRERARLQTFPDDYLFNGKNTEIRAQIGEAVPCICSYWISKAINEIEKLN